MGESLGDDKGWTTLTANVSTTVRAEPDSDIDTIIVIIWAIGGALLVTLIVLMICILRSHQKGRRNRTNLPPGRGNPRHGGVNHGFSTNYDEIWTWIPVITDSQARCPSQVNPSARTSSSQQQNNSTQQRTLLNNLRLPSYNEAVRSTSQNNQTSNQNRSNQPPASSHVTNHRNAANVSNRPRVQAQTSTNGASPSPEHHYETIPNDRFITSRHTNHLSTANNFSSVNVTSSSGAPVPTTSARISINQMSRRDNQRLPPVPSLQSPRPDRNELSLSANRIITGNLGQGTRTNTSAIRTTTSTIYPNIDNRSQRPAFQHSASSVFTYCGEHGSHNVFSNIPPSVPAVYEAPTLPLRGTNGAASHHSNSAEQPETSLSQSTRDALRRLESEYF